MRVAMIGVGAGTGARPAATPRSATAFQAPHDAQRPTHRALSAPQLSHTNSDRAFTRRTLDGVCYASGSGATSSKSTDGGSPSIPSKVSVGPSGPSVVSTTMV